MRTDAEMADAPTQEPLDGYRLINVSAVQGLIDALLCPKCHGGELSLQERGTGADLSFVEGCSSCGDIVAAPHSPPIGKSRQNELVMRLGVVGRDCRISFTKLSNLFGGINAPPPMHVKSYQKVAGKVHDAAMLAATQVMEEAARAVRKAQATEGTSAESDLLDVCISYDRTWHKRGHTSQFGVGVAIELETGFAMQSKYCHGCQLGPKEESCLRQPPEAIPQTRSPVTMPVHRARIHGATITATRLWRQQASLQHHDPTDPHRPAFPKDVAKEIVPIYNRLTQRELLIRCSRMKTQNANESFNALIWKRCPKTEFASLQTVETAVALAVLEFNLGPRGFERVLKEMNIAPGSHQAKHASKATRGKIAKAKVRALDTSKMAHKRRKLEAIVWEQRSLEGEGATYAPGGF
ncbi:hypothetical protein HPB47_006970 [Ixodes persulcatus]|uniref:Uncharacterized protein n=1 Tax=Ixodes persulcatus TaxID=34615 RepID=A0AC60P8X7_IXOPE|nr:hypothetical protein HPB47_006970 [Ixodes persulcatus]